jgi:hypothetical protein
MERFIKKILREGLINEAMSDVMYHFTHVNSAISILKSNSINFTAVHGIKADREKNYGKFYFLSLSSTRSAKDGYGKTITNNGVRLTLDGRALVNNHHITNKRIDFWDNNRTSSGVKTKDEMEERIISDSDSIGPANKYIKIIEVINGEPNELWQLKKWADKLNIPVYAYDNLDYYSLSIKSKAISITKPEVESEVKSFGSYGDIADLTSLLVYGDDELRKEIRRDLLKLGMEEDTVDRWIDRNQERVKEFILYRDSLGDLLTTTNAQLHNNKNSSNKFVRYIIRQFGKELRKHGLDSLRDYIQHKIFLGKKTDKMFKVEYLNGLHAVLNNTYNEELEKLTGRSYQLNGIHEDDLSSFEPAIKILKNTKELLAKKINEVINNHDGDMGGDLIRILMGFERDKLVELTDCREDADQFKHLENLIGEDAYDIYNAAMSMVSAVRWEASDLYNSIKDERDNQWVVSE